MGKQTIRDGKLVYYFDNLPDETRLRFHDSKLTLSAVPSNFRIVNVASVPEIVAEEDQESVSLTV